MTLQSYCTGSHQQGKLRTGNPKQIGGNEMRKHQN